MKLWKLWPYVVSALIVLGVCIWLTCKFKGCVDKVEEKLTGKTAAEEVLLGLRGHDPIAEDGNGSCPRPVAPKKKVKPSATKRPWFGTEETEGTEIVAVPAGDSSSHKDTIQLHVSETGTVTNLGEDSIMLQVTRVEKPWIQWDPGMGFCVLAGSGNRRESLIRDWQGMHLDLALQAKLVDLPVFQTGIEIGLPVLYVATSGVGLGLNVKHDAAEWLTVGGGYMWPGEEVQFGVGFEI